MKNVSIAVDGPSGAGKSTLVRTVNFLEKPTQGSILIDGIDLSTLSEKELRRKRREIGMIFQNFNLLEQKNVLDNICFPLEISGPSNDRFNTNPINEKFKSKAEIEHLAKSSPRIMALLKEHNLPLRVNMDALEEMI